MLELLYPYWNSAYWLKLKLINIETEMKLTGEKHQYSGGKGGKTESERFVWARKGEFF